MSQLSRKDPRSSERGDSRKPVSHWLRLFKCVWRNCTAPLRKFSSASTGGKTAIIGALGAICAALIVSPLGTELIRDLLHRHNVTIYADTWESGAGYPDSDTLVTFHNTETVYAPATQPNGDISKLFLEFNLFSLPGKIDVEHAELRIPIECRGHPDIMGMLCLRSLDYSDYSVREYNLYPWNERYVDRGSVVNIYWPRPPTEGHEVLRTKHKSLVSLVQSRLGSSIHLCMFFDSDSLGMVDQLSGYHVRSLPSLHISYVEVP